MNPERSRVLSQQALAVYAESLAAGRRVVVFGDASLGLGAQLAELGARSVFVWDPDVDRARREAERAPAGVFVRPLLGVNELDVSALFDLAVVGNLEVFDEPETLLAQVRRLVGEDGTALVVTPNGPASDRSPAYDYYELFDLVAREFDQVTMIAQLPFFGVALAELGEDEDESPSVSVDTQLAGGDRAPEAFIALASQRGARLDPYSIVELPRPQSASMPASHELAQRLEDALRHQASRVSELERELEHRTHQAAQLSGEIERARTADEELRAAVARLDEVTVRADRAERATNLLEAELARVGDAHAAEMGRLEEALRERAQSARLLEAELDRRERMVRELVGELEATAQARHAESGAADATELEPDVAQEKDALAGENTELRRKLDALALELARREGEMQARAWTITELERRLETAPAPPPASDASRAAMEHQLTATLDELDVLRRALTQEHEARLRAESGEPAPTPQAEAQRQS
jgi:SAM-dependent methyltransferase